MPNTDRRRKALEREGARKGALQAEPRGCPDALSSEQVYITAREIFEQIETMLELALAAGLSASTLDALRRARNEAERVLLVNVAPLRERN